MLWTPRGSPSASPQYHVLGGIKWGRISFAVTSCVEIFNSRCLDFGQGSSIDLLHTLSSTGAVSSRCCPAATLSAIWFPHCRRDHVGLWATSGWDRIHCVDGVAFREAFILAIKGWHIPIWPW